MTGAADLFSKRLRIATIGAITYRFVDASWRFAAERAEEIDAYWRERVALNPHLFNGHVLLMHRADPQFADGGGQLDGTCFLADYKAFLAWRAFGFPDASVANVFAMAALRSADGAFLLGEMGPKTANAGSLYFPAGTPDPQDVVDGTVDLESSVRRELKEETGLDVEGCGADALEPCPGWTVVFDGPYVACMKTIRSRLSAAELMAKVDDFLASEKEPELARVKPVFSDADFDDARMPDFMRAYMQHVWSTGG